MNAKKTYYILFYAAIIAFTSFFTSSCRKKRLETFVEGRVLTYGTNQKVSAKEFKINLYAETGGTGLSHPGETLLEQGSTDSNGYFSFDFKAVNDYSRHYIRIMEGAPLHHTPGYSASIYYLETGKRQTKNIYLSPHAWLKLHIENVNPQPGDEFSVNGGGDRVRFYGEVNEEVIFMGGGNINRSFVYTIHRNGIISPSRDTVWMPAWDTTYHKIEY